MGCREAELFVLTAMRAASTRRAGFCTTRALGARCMRTCVAKRNAGCVEARALCASPSCIVHFPALLPSLKFAFVHRISLLTLPRVVLCVQGLHGSRAVRTRRRGATRARVPPTLSFAACGGADAACTANTHAGTPQRRLAHFRLLEHAYAGAPASDVRRGGGLLPACGRTRSPRAESENEALTQTAASGDLARFPRPHLRNIVQ